MLTINNLSFSYGSKKVLNNINQNLETGKIYGLIGENGVGKTTFMKILSGILPLKEGEIYFNGEKNLKSNFFDKRISFVSDSPILLNDLTVMEHFLLICKINKYEKDEAINKIDKLINLFKLNEYRDSFGSSLSRGTKQKVSLIIGLLQEASLILMDEPFITLDPFQVESLQSALTDMIDIQKIIIVSSHDLESLKNISHNILLLNDTSIYQITKEETNLETLKRMLKNDNSK